LRTLAVKNNKKIICYCFKNQLITVEGIRKELTILPVEHMGDVGIEMFEVSNKFIYFNFLDINFGQRELVTCVTGKFLLPVSVQIQHSLPNHVEGWVTACSFELLKS
jgi:hypothetical protein